MHTGAKYAFMRFARQCVMRTQDRIYKNRMQWNDCKNKDIIIK